MHIISFIWTHFLSRIYFLFLFGLDNTIQIHSKPIQSFLSVFAHKSKRMGQKRIFCVYVLTVWLVCFHSLDAGSGRNQMCIHSLDETVLRQIRRMHVEIDASDILVDYTPILTPLFTNCCVFSQWMFNADWQTAGRVPANGLPAQRNIHSHSENWTRSRKCCIYYIFDNVFSIQLIKYYGSKISESTIKITHASKMIQNSRFLYRFFLKTNH